MKEADRLHNLPNDGLGGFMIPSGRFRGNSRTHTLYAPVWDRIIVDRGYEHWVFDRLDWRMWAMDWKMLASLLAKPILLFSAGAITNNNPQKLNVLAGHISRILIGPATWQSTFRIWLWWFGRKIFGRKMFGCTDGTFWNGKISDGQTDGTFPDGTNSARTDGQQRKKKHTRTHEKKHTFTHTHTKWNTKKKRQEKQ